MTRTNMDDAFRQAEASLILEGFDPSAVPEYRDLKASVLAGRISPREARDAYARLFSPGLQAVE